MNPEDTIWVLSFWWMPTVCTLKCHNGRRHFVRNPHTDRRGKNQRNAVFHIKGLSGSDGLWKQWLPLQRQDWSSWNGTDKPVEGFLDVSPKVPYPYFNVMSFNWGFKVPSDLNISLVSYSVRVKPKTSIYSAIFYDPHSLFPPFISTQNFFF